MIRTSSRLHEALLQEFQESTRLSPLKKKQSGNPSTSEPPKKPSPRKNVMAKKPSPPPAPPTKPPRVILASSSEETRGGGVGLIAPKKLPNPCLDSKEAMDVNREIKWNAKTGINVLASKSELERAMDRRKWQQKQEEREREEEEAKTDFQKMLEERKAREEKHQQQLPHQQQSQQQGIRNKQQQPEFLKIHAQLKHAAAGPDN